MCTRVLLLLASLAFSSFAANFWPVDSSVVELTDESFARKVGRKNQLTWVLFYSAKNKKSQAMKDEYNAFAAELKGQVVVAAIDCGKFKPLCKETQGVKKVPTIKSFSKGSLDGVLYEGKQESTALQEAAKKQIPSAKASKITELTYKTHGQWLEATKAMPRAVLFTAKKKEVPSLWRSMALQFKDRMTFAISRRSERKLNRKFAITEYPAMVVIPAQNEDALDEADDDDDDEREGDDSFVEFNDVITGASVQAFLDKYALEDPEAEEEALEVEELSDDSCMRAFCVDANGLCAVLVVSVDPTNPSSKRQLRDSVGVWAQVRSLRKDNLYNFAWVDGLKQMEFLDKALHM